MFFQYSPNFSRTTIRDLRVSNRKTEKIIMIPFLFLFFFCTEIVITDGPAIEILTLLKTFYRTVTECLADWIKFHFFNVYLVWLGNKVKRQENLPPMLCRYLCICFCVNFASRFKGQTHTHAHTKKYVSQWLVLLQIILGIWAKLNVFSIPW